ncbi:MAG: inositol monophosphatase [Brevinematales bacterium]|nr:inositol monophosphatase [Brevinematales bacterium]
MKQFLKVAIESALKAGKIIEKGFYSIKDVKYKSFANPVTEFDIASEDLIVSNISKHFKTHSFLAEENYSKQTKESYVWIIDPIDGTVNFTHQIPFVAVSIALEIEGDVKVGVVYNPILGELYTAIKGEGAYLSSSKFKNKRLYVSTEDDPAKSLIVTGFPYEREGRIDYLTEPIKTINRNFTGFRRLGSASIDLVYVARGSFEAFYEENLKPWDTAAGVLIVSEAGGKITNYYGENYDIYQKTIVASNGLIHDKVLDFTKNIPSPD